jgi:hypothetical protein
MSIAKRSLSFLALLGIQPTTATRSVCALPRFLVTYRGFRRLHREAGATFKLGKLYPCLADSAESAGIASGHYFHQDLLVARRIFEGRPRRHVDVGSRIDGFIAHLAVFREVEVFDVRPLGCQVRNIHFRQIDVINSTDESLDGLYDSASCLHALEHFGLGRYGDRIDYFGYLKGLRAISRLLRRDGVLYLSVPLGTQRIEFNAHRVFSISYLREICETEFNIQRFSYVDDAGDLHEDVPHNSPEAERSYDCHYGLAILEMVKK